MKIFSLLPLFLTAFFVSCSMSHAAEFSIISSDLKPGQTISDKHVFNGFGCNGRNISPQISWRNIPAETKSLALTVYDPDAPTGSGWWHWILVNIPANYTKISAGFGENNQHKLQDGIKQIRNDFGIFGFGGPCPPKGNKPHRYIFTIYALRLEKMDIDENATAALAGFIINQNTIARTSLTATYGR